MTHELFPHEFPVRQQAIAEAKANLAMKASKIIAISENTKRDVVRILGIPESKVSVIHLASSFPEIQNYEDEIHLPQKYLLYVGHRRGYKNFDFFIRASAPLLLSDSELNVVCVGGNPFTVEEVENFHSLKIANRISHQALSDGVLSAAYRKAHAFIFPSRYEGFGLPILEAFSCTCPVVASNTSSFPEVAGDAAIYFEPDDESSLQEAIRQVMDSNKRRDELRQRGSEQLKKFSWKKTAGLTEQLYREVLQN